jgi:hypothetical protein
VDTRTSITNCGGCGLGHACSTGQICESGACMVSACSPPCTTPTRCCVDACVNVTTDPNNCGYCGIRCLDDDPPLADSCVTPASGATHCSCHGSPRECVPPAICCPDACHNLTMDTNNCGACGNVCATGEDCVAGSCVCGTTGARCPDGQSCCSDACIDTTDDMANCGSCGNVCNPDLADACVAGACKCGSSGVCTRPGWLCEGGMVTWQKCCAGACVTLGTDTDCAECGAPCDTVAGELCGAVPPGFVPCVFSCTGV